MAVQTILVVDDSPTALQLISEPLTANGYQVITASDGEEALMRARQEMPNLIVLDIILPKLNGFQVCRQLKTDPATEGLKILLLSSKNQDSDKFWGEKQGADAYVTKPFEDEELLAGIRQLLAGRAVVH